MEGRVYSEILRRTEERRGANVIPEHTTLLDLRRWAYGRGMPDSELLSRLAELRESGRIEVGRTLNDWWIRSVEESEEK